MILEPRVVVMISWTRCQVAIAPAAAMGGVGATGAPGAAMIVVMLGGEVGGVKHLPFKKPFAARIRETVVAISTKRKVCLPAWTQP